MAPIAPLAADEAAALNRDGCLMLRGAIPQDWLEDLRASFEAGELPSEGWPVPRGHDWRHAMVDNDPLIQRVCRLPALLAASFQILAGPFFLAQVEGRAPRPHNMTQLLHADSETATAEWAVAFAFLDPFGPENGATQYVPGSHKAGNPSPHDPITAHGAAGDILVMDARVLHGATTNHNGAPRRSLLVNYAVGALYEQNWLTTSVRGIRMEPAEIFGA